MDIILDRFGGHIDPLSAAEADVTFSCDTEIYVLVMFGRLALQEAISDGRIVAEGRAELVPIFSRSFQGG